MTATLLSDSDARRLARYGTGQEAVDLAALVDPRARLLGIALMHDGRDPAATLRDALAGVAEGSALQEQIAAIDTEAVASTPAYRYTLHNWSEVWQPTPPIDWVVRGFVEAGTLTVIYGEPGCRKTYLANDLLLAVASKATEWLGMAVVGGPSLVIDEETGEHAMRRRLATVARGRGLQSMALPVTYTSMEGVNLYTSPTEELAQLKALLTEQRPRLVVVDALSEVAAGADENSVRDMLPIMLMLRRLANVHHCAIVLIHHTNKAGTDRGSIAIRQVAGYMLHVEGKDETMLKASTTKQRDAPPLTFAANVTFTAPDTPESVMTFTAAATTEKHQPIAPAEAYVLGYLEKHGRSLLTNIANYADTCSTSAARKAIYTLADKGRVRRADARGPGSKAEYELVVPATNDTGL